MKHFWFWLTHNASSAHHRALARYLKRRGWVVFYLEPRARECVKGHPHGCWLALYESGEKQANG